MYKDLTDLIIKRCNYALKLQQAYIGKATFKIYLALKEKENK